MIVFVHNNKTAGTTLKFILRNSFGIHHCDSAKSKTKPFLQKDLRFAKKVFFGINSIAGHNLVEPTKHLTDPDLDFITILRDPVKRCASHYQDKVARGRINEPFESWIKNKRFRNVMVNRIAGGPDPDKAYELLKNRYLLVGLTEKFNEFLRMLGIVSPYKINIKYKKKLVNSDNSVKRKILSDKKNLKVLKEGNELDIILYKKVINELYPVYIRKYREALEKMKHEFLEKRMLFRMKKRLSITYNKGIYRQLVKIKSVKERF